MNYLPFAGYWFYGAASALQRAAFYCSWGLLAIAPTTENSPTSIIYGGLVGPLGGPV